MTTFYLRKCMVALSMAICLGTSVYAQKYYNLQDLVTAGNNHLPLLQQKQALVNSAKASVTEVRHSVLPQVKFSEQLSAGSDNSLAGSYFTMGITPSTSAGIRSSNTLEAATGNTAVLYGEYELVNFGLNNAKVQYAQSFVNLQEADRQREQYLVSMEVARLYFATLKTQYRLEADRQNVKRYDSIFTIIRALTLSGLKAGSDSSLAKAELSKTRITYNQTSGILSQLKDQLTYYTGIPPVELLLDGSVNHFQKAIPAPMQYVQDTTQNPLLDYFAKKKNIFQSREQLIKKSYLPKIMLAGSTWARGSSIQFSDQYKPLETGLGYQRFNYALGVAFTYNLFNGMFKRDKLAINRFDTEASYQELEQEKASVNNAYTQADHAMQTIQANLTELPVQLKSASDTYQQKLAQYKAGIISLIDLTNASFVLYRSETDYIETVNDWYLAQMNKAALTGNLTQFIQTIR
ncbi:MAG: TolC family protein [Bacteroidota bacterium]